jgi:hypothetical protein
MSNVTIVSDGTAIGTTVKIDDNFIKGITKIEFGELNPRGLLTVKLSLNVKALNIAIKDAEIIGDETVVLAVRKILDEAIDSNS